MHLITNLLWFIGFIEWTDIFLFFGSNSLCISLIVVWASWFFTGFIITGRNMINRFPCILRLISSMCFITTCSLAFSSFLNFFWKLIKYFIFCDGDLSKHERKKSIGFESVSIPAWGTQSSLNWKWMWKWKKEDLITRNNKGSSTYSWGPQILISCKLISMIQKHSWVANPSRF